MPLIRTPNLADADGFYERLIGSQRELSDEQASMMDAKLVLILANHIGDMTVLHEAIALALDNTLANATTSAIAGTATEGTTR